MAEGLVAAPGEAAAPRGRSSRALRVAFGGAGGVGAAIVAVVTLAAVFAPWVAPYDPVALNPPARLQGPSAENLLGTDQYGRDTLSRIVYGGRASLSVAGASTLFALLVGGALGVLAGFYRGWVDGLIMRVTDVLLSFPAILLAIALLAFLGPGFVNLVLAIGLVYVGPFARVARGAVMTVREELFVEASRSLGSRDWRVLLRAVLPAAAAPLIVEVTLRLAYGILAEASLSFLGLGTQPPAASWGLMVAEGRRFLSLSPWATVAPGLAIMLVVLGFNLFGDALRDALDPRTRLRR
ncbi:MAG TPA: ABC transporter permease [Trueperaceae bacterium]|nr:ABC transporter permease [Trueperaceae bacterium]